MTCSHIELHSHPVNFVEVVRLQHSRANDTSAIGGSHLNLDPAEENVEVALNGRSITLFGDSELGTKRGALDSTSSGVPLAECRRARGEVGVELPLGKTGVGRTCLCISSVSHGDTLAVEGIDRLFSGLQVV